MRNLLDEAPSTDVHPLAARALTFSGREAIEGKDVLDVGCGFGWFEAVALEQGVRSVTGIEPEEEVLDLPRRSLPDERATFMAASAIELPFDDASFDTAVAWEVIEHIPEDTEDRFFAELARVLRPGGTLYLSTPYAAPASKVTDPAWWLIDHRHYRAGDLIPLAEAAGLRPDRMQVRGRSWQVAYALNLYFSKWVLRRGLLAEPTFRREAEKEFDTPGWCNLFMRFAR